MTNSGPFLSSRFIDKPSSIQAKLNIQNLEHKRLIYTKDKTKDTSSNEDSVHTTGLRLKILQNGTICWKTEGVAWWICSLGKFREFSICSLWCWLKALQRIFRRQTRGRIRGQTQCQKPEGLQAPVFFGQGSGLWCGRGFAWGKSWGGPSINSRGNR